MSVGDVLGTPEESIRKLKHTIKPGGYILIDDAYGKKGAKEDYYTKLENEIMGVTFVKSISIFAD